MTWIVTRCLCGILALLMVSTGGVGWAADPIEVAWMNVPTIAGAGVAAAATTTYFGNQTNKDAPAGGAYSTSWGGFTFSHSNDSDQTAPSNGTIVELCAYVKFAAGTAGNFRLAVYDDQTSSDNNLVCQMSAEIGTPTVTTTAAWVCGTSLTGTCAVTSGTKYHFAITTDDNNLQFYYIATGDSSLAVYYSATDYTGGFPSTLSLHDANGTGNRPHLIIGIQ